MAVQPIGGVAGAAYPAPSGATAPTDATRRAELEAKDSTAKDSTIVISKVTREKPDGSTVTTITYADGHTRIETTPPKFATEDSKGQQGDGRVTAVDILA